MCILFGVIVSLTVIELSLRAGAFAISTLQEYKNTLKLREKAEITIMCIGESTTAGPYPDILEKVLNERSRTNKFRVINKGLGGCVTDDIVAGLADNLNTYKPDIVVSMIGINDGVYILNKRMKSKGAEANHSIFADLRIYYLFSCLKESYCRPNVSSIPRDDKTECMPLAAKSATAKSEFNNNALLKIYINEKRYKEAENIFEEEARAGRKNADLYLWMGASLFLRGEVKKAKYIFDEAINIDPQNALTYCRIGETYGNQNMLQDAIFSYKKGSEVDKDDALPYLGFARILKMQGKRKEEEKILLRALGCFGKNRERLLGAIGVYYLENGKEELAERYFKEAEELMINGYNESIVSNYEKIFQETSKRKIRLIAMQYPMLSVSPLKEILRRHKEVIFVDNDKIFKNAVRGASYGEYFFDQFAGGFGHCTNKGDTLLSENLADAILKHALGY